MHFKILFFILILNVMWSSQLLDSDRYELVPVINPNGPVVHHVTIGPTRTPTRRVSTKNIRLAGNAPFFELPCMIVGGTCAKPMYCPDGTRVATRGLCPVQQEQGMECCRPTSQDVTCHSKGGECVSNHYKCPRLLEVKEANDCGLDNTCCAFV